MMFSNVPKYRPERHIPEYRVGLVTNGLRGSDVGTRSVMQGLTADPQTVHIRGSENVTRSSC